MLDKIWLVHPEAEMCEAWSKRFAGLRGVRVIQDRFENLEPHDAFVTAGNSFGIMTAGIDAAVVHFFGESLMERVQDHILNHYLGEQPVGSAFVASTQNEKIAYLVHAPTMRVPGSISGTDKVYSATWAALTTVHQFNLTADPQIETIAFPAFGTGFGGVPYSECARQMAAAWRHYWEPPTRLDWDAVVIRHKAIAYDGGKQVAK